MLLSIIMDAFILFLRLWQLIRHAPFLGLMNFLLFPEFVFMLTC